MIRVNTAAPAALLRKICSAIDAGTVRTWSYDSDGDFTHTADQWNLQAWLRPSVLSGALKFNILAPRGVHMSKPTYGVYHGRFIEMLVTHFDEDFDEVVATAMPTRGDTVKSE